MRENARTVEDETAELSPEPLDYRDIGGNASHDQAARAGGSKVAKCTKRASYAAQQRDGMRGSLDGMAEFTSARRPSARPPWLSTAEG